MFHYPFRRIAAAALLLAGSASSIASDWGATRPNHPTVQLASMTTKTLAADPTGDLFGPDPQLDIASIEVVTVGISLIIEVVMNTPISRTDAGDSVDDRLFGYFDIDVGGNDLGMTNNSGFCASGQGPTIPADFSVILFDTSNADEAVVVDHEGNFVDFASVLFGTQSISVVVPLQSIGGTNQPISAGAILGNVTNATDCAPNSGGVDATFAGASAIFAPPEVPKVGNNVRLHATCSLTGQSMEFQWDLDGDGITDRFSDQEALSVTFPSTSERQINVVISDETGGEAFASLIVRSDGPLISSELESVNATEVCGNSNGQFDPGERFTVPLRIRNNGNKAAADGYATYAASDRLDAAGTGVAISGDVVVENSVIPVGDLAAGSEVLRDLIFTIDEGAECGRSHSFVYQGGVDKTSFGDGDSSPFVQFPIASNCQVFTGCPPAAAKAKIAPRQGLFLDADRAGNGLSNFIIPDGSGGEVFFGAWFTAEADRTPTWYIVQGPMVGNSVVAPIYRFTRDVNASTFQVNSTTVGQAIVGMLTPEQMVFRYQVGNAQGLEVFDYFVGGDAPDPNRTGAWFNESESGWGQVIHEFLASGQPNLFVVHYLYDDNGDPRWVIGQGPTPNLANATAHQTFRVHCPGCPWLADWVEFPIQVGQGSAEFFSATQGSTTVGFSLPAPFAGNWNRDDFSITLLTVPQ